MRFELYTAGAPAPDALWGVVGEPRRLPAWTDADEVLSVEPEPLAVGSEIVVAVDGAVQRWRVVTLEPRLVEVRREARSGPVGIGAKVAADPRGSRLVLAGEVAASGPLGGISARLLAGPAFRRRLDRWAAAAMQEAQRS
jgi:hypothetical protein